MKKTFILIVLILFSLSGCATTPPVEKKGSLKRNGNNFISTYPEFNLKVSPEFRFVSKEMQEDFDIGLKDTKVNLVSYIFHDRATYESTDEQEYKKTLAICHIENNLYKFKNSDIENLAKVIAVSSDYYVFRVESVNTGLKKYRYIMSFYPNPTLAVILSMAPQNYSTYLMIFIYGFHPFSLHDMFFVNYIERISDIDELNDEDKVNEFLNNAINSFSIDK